jgi:hypothetical protein
MEEDVKKAIVLAEKDGWFMLESEDGEWYFGRRDGELSKPEDCPVSELMIIAAKNKKLRVN